MKEIREIKEDLNRELRRIVKVIIQEYSPESIILFGSLANGEVRESSDIDLVIIKDTDDKFMQRLHKVRLMTKPEVGADFIVYTPQELEDMRKEKRGFLLKEILQKGEVLYERKEQMA